MAIAIQINKNVIQDFYQTIENKSLEELKKQGVQESVILKKIAADFLIVLQDALTSIKLIQQYSEILKSLRANLKDEDLKNVKQTEQYQIHQNQLKELLNNSVLLTFLKETLRFNDRILQIITGHKQRISIVIPDAGGNPIIQDFTLDEILQGKSGVSIMASINSNQKLAGRLNYDIDQIKQRLNQTLHRDNMISLSELSALNKTYTSALYDNYNKHNPYVFWKPLNAQKWLKMKVVGGAGDISEAYAYFYYKGADNHFNFSINHLYDNLDTFFRIGVAQVSNVSGLYAADVSTKEYDYAIKSLKASLPGFTQMFILARDIMNNKVKDFKVLQKKAKQKQYTKTGLEKGLRNKVEEVVDIITENV